MPDPLDNFGNVGEFGEEVDRLLPTLLARPDCLIDSFQNEIARQCASFGRDLIADDFLVVIAPR